MTEDEQFQTDHEASVNLLTEAGPEKLSEEAEADPLFADVRALLDKSLTALPEDMKRLIQKAHDLLTDFLLRHPEEFYDPKELDSLRKFADELSDDPRWANIETEHMLWLFELDHGRAPTSIEEYQAWRTRTNPKLLTELTRMDLRDIFDKMVAGGYAVEVASLH